MNATFALYVYYRVQPDDLVNACERSNALMQAMHGRTGAHTQLMRRSDETGKPYLTLMEIYAFSEGTPDEAQQTLNELTIQMLGENSRTERHCEVFVQQALL